MSRLIGRSVIIGLGLAGLAAAIAFAPDALRRMDVFRVERVEVEGSRFVAPNEVLERSGITRASNVFDDADVWRATLRAHPVIEDVRVERRLPGTLVLRVTEVEPIALVRRPELRMAASDGRVLPVDPAGFDVDLPIVEVAAEVDEDRERIVGSALRLVDTLARLRRLEPAIASRVSEMREGPGGAIRLVLTAPDGAEVIVPGDAPAPRLRALRLTLADLAQRSDLSRVRRVDLRFRDQVVVSMTPSAAS